MTDSPDTGNDESLLDSVGGLARLAAGAWVRTASWGLGASVRTGARLARAAVDPGSAAKLAQGVGSGLRGYAREMLGVSDLDERLTQLMRPRLEAGGGSAADADAEGEQASPARGGNGLPPESAALRLQGAELLRQSADVELDDRAHPAYARILEELAPDEARILRLLAIKGPQPTVDVRSTHLIGLGSQLAAGGLNMIGPEAGCRHPERVHAYLNNLNRLGLIWFSREPLENLSTYQVLEAQPEVLRALKGNPRSKTVQRSIRLTPFGKDFCEVCLPLEPAEIEALRSQRS